MSLSYDKFILLGDSLTQFANAQKDGFGVHPALQDAYTRKLDVINRGYSGYNSSHLVFLLPRILKAELNDAKDNVKLMTIFIGSNDALQLDDNKGKIQAQSKEVYAQNLSKLIQMAVDNNIKPIVISPTLHDQKLSVELLNKNNRPTTVPLSSNSRNREYAVTAGEVAKEHDVPFINFWDALRDAGNYDEKKLLADEVDLSEYLCDGIHFAGKAYRVLYDEIINAIKSNYPELSHENLPLKLAEWHQIDIDDFEGSILK